MEKGTISKKLTALGVLLIVFITSTLVVQIYKPTSDGSTSDPSTVPASLRVPISARLVIPSHEKKLVDEMFFKGQNGINALDLLKKIVTVEQDKSGLVIAINDRKADNGKHEYWAFYVNGKMASVGPADYKTKDTDTIQWKIEKY